MLLNRLPKFKREESESSVKFMGSVLVEKGEISRPVRINIFQVIMGRPLCEIVCLQGYVNRAKALKEGFWIIGDIRIFLESPTELVRLPNNIFDGESSIKRPVERHMSYSYLPDLWFRPGFMINV